MNILEEMQDAILGNLVRAVELLKQCEFLSELMPEVRMNIAYAIPKAKSINDVAAIPGRITAYNGVLIVPGYPAFGASDHLARAILEAQKHDPAIRAAVNFKYMKELHKWLETYCKKENLVLICVDRTKEPSEVSAVDGKSMPWKIKKAVELAHDKVPDLMCETEALGKEPLFKIFGKSATEVANKLIKIANAWATKK
jgi:hydroxymethylpyrimidine/phosphomethylpyrimidine kinase